MEEDLRNVGETAAEEINETAPEDPVKESEETLTAEDAVQEAVKKAYEAAGEEPPEMEEEPAEDDKQTADEKEEEAGGLFGRKERKLKKELEQKCEELAEKQNSFLRLMAEFDNFRKRTEKEKSGMYAMGAKDVIEKILPVLDNFERGFSLVTEEDKEDAFVQGMEKIYLSRCSKSWA